MPITIHIRILSYKSPQRYAVKRTLVAAHDDLQKAHPHFEIAIEEVKELSEIEKYTAVVILPGLIVDENLVCVGRFPKRDEVIGWLQDALEAHRE